jgi:hypothetical protein
MIMFTATPYGFKNYGDSVSDFVGLIPLFLDEGNPASAREQFNKSYAHGGGWMPMPGWKMNVLGQIIYPGDPPMTPVAVAKLRDETIFIYRHAWVAIVQKDFAFEVARVD